MRTSTRFGALAVVISGLALPLGAQNPSQIVLRVDGIDISRPQFELAKKAIEEGAGGQKLEGAAAVRSAVDQLIGRALLVEAATKAGIAVSDGEVQAGLAQQRRQPGGEEMLARLVSEFHLTDQELATLERDRLLVQRYVQTQVAPSLEPTGEQLQEYFKAHPDEFNHGEEVRVRVILKSARPSDPESVRDAAKKAVEAAAARIAAGEDFGKVAAEVSDDPSRARDGELGWVPRGRLLAELDGAAFALKPGQVSGVIESPIGWHLIQVEARREPGPLSYAEVEPRLKEYLTQRRIGEAVARLIAEKRSVAKIEAIDPEIARTISGAGATQTPTPRPTGGSGTP